MVLTMHHSSTNDSSLQRAARDFYNGMVTCVLEADSRFIPYAREEFGHRDAAAQFERAINKRIDFSKHMREPMAGGIHHVPVTHNTSRFRLELFCCLSALNLYRAKPRMERLKEELLEANFFHICDEKELDWLGVYDADLPYFKEETGYTLGQWRMQVVKRYLRALQHKSSRDADVLVALNLLLERNDLAKAHGVPVSPVLLEKLAEKLEIPARWLENYLQFHKL